MLLPYHKRITCSKQFCPFLRDWAMSTSPKEVNLEWIASSGKEDLTVVESVHWFSCFENEIWQINNIDLLPLSKIDRHNCFICSLVLHVIIFAVRNLMLILNCLFEQQVKSQLIRDSNHLRFKFFSEHWVEIDLSQCPKPQTNVELFGRGFNKKWSEPIKGSWEAFCWLHMTNSNVEETTVVKCLIVNKLFLWLNGSLEKQLQWQLKSCPDVIYTAGWKYFVEQPKNCVYSQ